MYESEEDAAFAAGVITRNLTNESNLEYLCGIYKTDTGEYVVGGAFEGEHASVSIDYTLYENESYSNWTLVAMVHSHPYCNGHIPNEFSTTDANGKVIGDLYVAAKYELPLYLAAPNGYLKVLIVYDVQILPNNQKSFRCAINNVRNGLPIDDTQYHCR